MRRASWSLPCLVDLKDRGSRPSCRRAQGGGCKEEGASEEGELEFPRLMDVRGIEELVRRREERRQERVGMFPRWLRLLGKISISSCESA